MALVAGAILGWEVLITRLASLRYHFHFGHLAVSNGLLGIGAAASWLGAAEMVDATDESSTASTDSSLIEQVEAAAFTERAHILKRLLEDEALVKELNVVIIPA